MRDRLRALRERPIRDSERMPLFLGAVVVLIAATLAFGALGRPGDDPAPAAPSVSEPEPASGDEAAPELADLGDLPIPSEEEPVDPEDAPSAEDVDGARAAAERFLEGGYLAYTYGRTRVEQMPLATPELRAELAQSPPRVPLGAGRGRPVVETLQIEGASVERAAVLALVDDGERTYTLSVALARYEGGWRVTEVQT